jgi:hypothetical protein
VAMVGPLPGLLCKLDYRIECQLQRTECQVQRYCYHGSCVHPKLAMGYD